MSDLNKWCPSVTFAHVPYNSRGIPVYVLSIYYIPALLSPHLADALPRHVLYSSGGNLVY